MLTEEIHQSKNMEGDAKKSRMDLWTPEQVRMLFSQNAKELIAGMTVMELIFAYEAYPFIRPRFQTENLWETAYQIRVVPRLTQLGIPVKSLGDNARHNCLAWYFALMYYEGLAGLEDAELRRWFITNQLRAADRKRGLVNVDYNRLFDTKIEISCSSFTKVRSRILSALGESLFDNPSFETTGSLIFGFHKLEWVMTQVKSTVLVPQLAQIYHAFFSEGYYLEIHYSDRERYGPDGKDFYIRNKISEL